MFWYDYLKRKFEEQLKLCYMDSGNFIVYIKTEDIYSGSAKKAETRFIT